MAEPYPYEKRNWYPHMMPKDVELWERFIIRHPDAYDWVEYDVKVGTIPDFVNEHPEESMRNESALYARKIDVIGHKGTALDIIELKPRAGSAAVGQVRKYAMLYKRDIEPASSPRVIVITDTPTPDTEEFAAEMDVKIIKV